MAMATSRSAGAKYKNQAAKEAAKRAKKSDAWKCPMGVLATPEFDFVLNVGFISRTKGKTGNSVGEYCCTSEGV